MRTASTVETDIVPNAAQNDCTDCSSSNNNSNLQNRYVLFFLFVAASVVYFEKVSVEERGVESSVIGWYHRHCFRDSVEFFVVMFAQTSVSAIAWLCVPIYISAFRHETSPQVPIFLVVKITDKHCLRYVLLIWIEVRDVCWGLEQHTLRCIQTAIHEFTPVSDLGCFDSSK